MEKMLGTEYEAFLKSYEEPRKFGLRVNTAKISVEKFQELAPFHLTPIPWIPNGFYYEREDDPARHPFYYAGLYYLQEPSAMTPAMVLPVVPGERVLDLCAAPGGKATALGAKLRGEGLLVANDISASRAKALLKNLALFVLGAACLVVGSNLLVDNGTVLAQLLGVSERIIAVTMVAIGTSLPELVTAITAIVKKQSSMSVGNILGANIIDITIILPLCALISGDGLQIAAQSVRQTVYLDMPMCVLETAIAVIPTMLCKRFTKLQGIIMAALYIAYVFVTVRI